MLVIVEDGKTRKYSYRKLKEDNPSTSFPSHIPEELLEEYSVFVTVTEDRPETLSGQVAEKSMEPSYINGTWTYVWSIRPQSQEELELERESWSCSPLQGKLALGEETWGLVEAMLTDPETPFAMRIAITSAVQWDRTSQMMDELAWIMGLTDEQVDDLFRAAMDIEV